MSQWRVRLYALSAEDWDELGTGQLSLQSTRLSLCTPEYAEPLLDHLVQDELYRRQGSTIVLFSTTALLSYALSFQSEDHATELLEALCALQGRQLADIPQEDESEEESLPEMDTLSELPARLKDLRLAGENAEQVANESFLKRLDQLLAQAEREKSPLVQQLFESFRELLQWSNETLLLSLLSDLHYCTLFGALECKLHVDAPEFRSAHFRVFLQEAKFVNVLETEDSVFLSLVHRCYRLQLLKDAALPRGVDENCAAFLMATQLGLWTAILDYFLQSRELQRRFGEQLKALSKPAFSLLGEFNSMAKSTAPCLRVEFYELLLEQGLLTLAVQVLTEQLPYSLRIIEVFTGALSAVPAKARAGLAQSLLLRLVCKGFLEASEISAIQVFSEFLQAALEPIPEVRLNELLDALYELLPELAGVLKSLPTEEAGQLRVSEVLSLLRMCVESHGFRVRYLLSSQEVLRSCGKLLKDKTLVVGALQLLRTVVDRRDSHLAQHLANEGVLEGVWELFTEHESRESLVFSLCLSLAKSVQQAESRQLDASVAESEAVLGSLKLRACLAEALDRASAKRRRGPDSAEKRVKC